MLLRSKKRTPIFAMLFITGNILTCVCYFGPAIKYILYYCWVYNLYIFKTKVHKNLGKIGVLCQSCAFFNKIAKWQYNGQSYWGGLHALSNMLDMRIRIYKNLTNTFVVLIFSTSKVWCQTTSQFLPFFWCFRDLWEPIR